MNAVTLFALTALLGLLLHRLLRFLQWRQQITKIPGRKPHWLWGNTLQLGKGNQILQYVMEASKGNDVYRSLFPTHAVVAANSPEAARHLLALTNEPKGWGYGALHLWLGQGLLTANGAHWLRARKMLTPAFHFQILHKYSDVYSQATHILIGKWREHIEKADKDGSGPPTVELFHDISLLTLDVISRCALSYESNCQLAAESENEYIKSVYALSEMTLDRFINPHYVMLGHWAYSFTGHYRRYREHCRVVHALAERIIKQRREELRQAEQDGGDSTEQHTGGRRRLQDFLDILLTAKDEQGNGLTDTEIREQVDTFMFEGHDTTASGLSWLLYNLATHPECQQRCFEEAREVLGGRSPEHQDFDKLTYIHACIRESQRTHPPVPGIGREATEDMVLCGHKVPKGTQLEVSIYTLHHNEDYWPDPYKFDPTRFLDASAKGKDNFAFVPFSAGARNCVGQQLAIHETKAAVAMLLQAFRLDVDPSAPPPIPSPALVLRSESGVHVRLHPRE